MPRKKVRPEKDRAYLEKLLDDAGVDDAAIAEAIKTGLKSADSTERKNAVNMAAKMRGFEDVDKNAGQELIPLPLANCGLEDVYQLVNRCAYCKHGAFVPIRKSVESADMPAIPGNPGTEPATPIPDPEPAAGAETEAGSAPGGFTPCADEVFLEKQNKLHVDQEEQISHEPNP